MGGWGDDTPEETLNNVKQMVKDRRLDIPIDQAFVPGVRRGYAILPYGAKEGEDQQQLRERLSAALKELGKPTYRWGPTQMGRRSTCGSSCRSRQKDAGESSSQGGAKDFASLWGRLETEWPTGTVWLRGVRVCSATTTQPGEAEEAGAGYCCKKSLQR